MFRSIRTRILIASLSILAAALLANAALNYFVANIFSKQSIVSNLDSVSAGHVAGIDDWVATRAQMIISLRTAASEPDPLSTFIDVQNAGGFTAVFMGRADKTFVSTAKTNLPSDFNPVERPWYKQATASGKPIVTTPYIDITSGKYVVAFAAPAEGPNGIKEVVGGNVSMATVLANVDAIHPTPSSLGILFAGNGNIIAFSDAKMIGKPISTLIPDLSISALTSATQPLPVKINGATKLLKVTPIKGTDWHVVVALDEAEATAGMRSQLSAAILVLVAIMIVAALVMYAVTTILLRRLDTIKDAMIAISSGSGDLTKRLPAAGEDELAQLSAAFNRFAEKLLIVTRQVRVISEAVREAANQIASGNEELSGRTEAAAASLEQTATSIEEITSTVSLSASAAKDANSKSTDASTIAARGGEVITGVIAYMQEIEVAAGRIRSIISAIDGIAFQTNILALNAAVEAARAGEQGRGFAVVSSEVRSLAQRSAQAAKEIKGLIEATIDSIASGSSRVAVAGQTMQEIVASVNDVKTMMGQVSEAADEQTLGIHEVNRAMGQLEAMVQQNSVLVQESTATASTLLLQANELAVTVSQFKTDSD
ncbi:methyl-accepting chemotaxis protein [Herbaspirillum sp. NPDC101396]|uniref:methyl-accepting chemotaxis protein n=1 Tax=Herbaspirillum sp. NPDC101396 TaxID=3364005 RepID=UPI00383B692F